MRQKCRNGGDNIACMTTRVKTETADLGKYHDAVPLEDDLQPRLDDYDNGYAVNDFKTPE